MDETWIRRLSLALVPVGVAIAVLGFGVVGTMEGVLGVGVVVAGVVLTVLTPASGDHGGRDDVADRPNRRLILLVSLVGGTVMGSYVIAGFL